MQLLFAHPAEPEPTHEINVWVERDGEVYRGVMEAIAPDTKRRTGWSDPCPISAHHTGYMQVLAGLQWMGVLEWQQVKAIRLAVNKECK